MFTPQFVLPGVLARHDPDHGDSAARANGRVEPVPVVFDSPHSGNEYPDDFGHAVDHHALRAGEDMYVDELFSMAPAYGATLLRALFPRSYIDVNRHPLDLDPDLLEGEWPEALRPGGKTRAGKGLIRTLAQDSPVYDRKLSVEEVQSRLQRYYRPYHDALHEVIQTTRARHGNVWHVNCHSWTPPESGRGGLPVNHVDFSLGNRDGTTCEPEFTHHVAGVLRGMGYEVRVNRPFRGMECIKRHGRPAIGQHSLQIEINRNLYMDRRSYDKVAGFSILRANLERLVATICEYARARQPQESARAMAVPATASGRRT